MNDREWDAFAALLDATFTGALNESREAALRIHFGRVPLGAAERAIADMVMRGQTFMPVSAELVAALRRTSDGAFHLRQLLAGTAEKPAALLPRGGDDGH